MEPYSSEVIWNNTWTILKLWLIEETRKYRSFCNKWLPKFNWILSIIQMFKNDIKPRFPHHQLHTSDCTIITYHSFSSFFLLGQQCGKWDLLLNIWIKLRLGANWTISTSQNLKCRKLWRAKHILIVQFIICVISVFTVSKVEDPRNYLTDQLRYVGVVAQSEVHSLVWPDL